MQRRERRRSSQQTLVHMCTHESFAGESVTCADFLWRLVHCMRPTVPADSRPYQNNILKFCLECTFKRTGGLVCLLRFHAAASGSAMWRATGADSLISFQEVSADIYWNQLQSTSHHDPERISFKNARRLSKLCSFQRLHSDLFFPGSLDHRAAPLPVTGRQRSCWIQHLQLPFQVSKTRFVRLHN
jgi:hypothetical protein